MTTTRIACALALLLAACGRVEPDYLPSGGGAHPGGSNPGSPDGGTSDGGTPDAGMPGGGLPTTSCGSDPDGVSNQDTDGLVVSEIAFDERGFLELHNRGPGALDLRYVQSEGTVPLALPQRTLAAGEKLLVPSATLPNSAELALRVDGQLTTYVCWGTLPATQLQALATTAGAWSSPGVCPLQPAPGQSLHLRGSGVFAGDFQAAAPTPLGCAQ